MLSAMRKIMMVATVLVAVAGAMSVTFGQAPASRIQLDKIKLPAGFHISIFAEGLRSARSMTQSPSGTIFVGSDKAGSVYALRDDNKDGKADKVITVVSGLDTPNGVAFRDGALYVAEVNRVLRFDKIEPGLAASGPPVVVSDKFPSDKHHGWKFIRFGPDGMLYVPVGAPCNVCDRGDPYNTIWRMKPDGSGLEIFARGVRNTVGFDWHPVTKELWFTDNGRDWAGNAGPEDELNVIAKGKEGAFYGFPYCHANGIADPDIKIPNPCAGVTLPAALTGPHSAGLGIKFYTGNMFPKSYQNVAFIARHGSWNREKKFGYDVAIARTSGGKAKIEPFLTGLLNEEKNEFYGRPSYVFQMKDGSLLVSDENNGAVYRISYGDPKTASR
jgi:glucose/arabinose dehydrogenase